MTPHTGKNPGGHGYLAALCASLCLLGTEVAHAQPQTLLNWEAPPTCPQGDEVMAAVREIAGDQVLATTSLHATGSIRRLNDKFRLELTIQSETGTYIRTLDARSCGDLLNAAAVVLGLNLKRASAEVSGGSESTGASGTGGDQDNQSTRDDQAAARSEPTGTPSVTIAPSQTPSKPTSSDEGPARTAATDPLGIWVGPQLQGAVGALPDPSLWWGVSVGKRLEHWMVWLAGRYHSPQQGASDPQSDVGIQVTRYGGEVGVARSFRGSQLELAPGVLLEAERLLVRGTGQDLVSTSATSNIVLVGVGVTGRWFVTDWLVIALAIGVDVPTSRPRFQVQRLGEQGQLGSVIGRSGLGAEWNF